MLTKQKKSPYWYAVLYNRGNRRKWVSSRTRSKKEAKIFHDEGLFARSSKDKVWHSNIIILIFNFTRGKYAGIFNLRLSFS